MNAAVEQMPGMIAPLALGFFAGIRTAEIRRLTWEKHIDQERGLITVTEDVAKKRSVRNVQILHNLMQWLGAAPVKAGPVAPSSEGTWRHGFDLVRMKAGITSWPRNCMRHSYGSYHLEYFGDPVRTAMQMGHRDSGDLLFEHYRQLCDRQTALAYWRIIPPTS